MQGQLTTASHNSSKRKLHLLLLIMTDVDSFEAKAKSACNLYEDITV